MNRKPVHQTASFFLCIYLVFVAVSCRSASHANYTQYTALGPVNCNGKAQNIFLFFEGENVNFEYQKLGLVRVNFHKEELVYQLMKQEAWNACGNALIQVKKVSEPEVYTDVNGNVNTRTNSYYTGIVVQIDENSAFWEKHKTEVDTSFLAYNRNQDEKLQSARGGGFVMTLGIIGALTMLAIGLGAHP
ncbi:MAG: putative lipoprotein precursor [Crocinitomicaceae bacterium]|jgi:hypothetical protein|nr:putative lipoprotein precursor [Crocinitomicaceae bacterium]